MVIEGRGREVFAGDFPLGVVEEPFALAGVPPAVGRRLFPDPGHEPLQPLAQGPHAFLGWFAPPFSHLGLIGEFFHAEKFLRQRIIVERLAVGETTAARTERVDQPADDDLRAVTAPAVLARVQAADLAPLVPEAKPSGHRLDGDQSGMNGRLGVGDKLKFEARVLLGDRGHIGQTLRRKKNSPEIARSMRIVMIRVTWLPEFTPDPRATAPVKEQGCKADDSHLPRKLDEGYW